MIGFPGCNVCEAAANARKLLQQSKQLLCAIRVSVMFAVNALRHSELYQAKLHHNTLFA